jgi:hypothetical protein
LFGIAGLPCRVVAPFGALRRGHGRVWAVPAMAPAALVVGCLFGWLFGCLRPVRPRPVLFRVFRVLRGARGGSGEEARAAPGRRRGSGGAGDGGRAAGGGRGGERKTRETRRARGKGAWRSGWAGLDEPESLILAQSERWRHA